MIAVTDPIALYQSQLREMATEQLREEFRGGLQLSVEHLTRLACVLMELESRGETVEGVSEGLLSLLRRIAKGEVLAEMVVCFASAPQAMRRAANLPIEEQRALLGDEKKCERIKKRSNRSPSAYHRGSPKDWENPLIAASLATPKDLAELIVEMIERHPKPDVVWKEVQTAMKKQCV